MYKGTKRRILRAGYLESSSKAKTALLAVFTLSIITIISTISYAYFTATATMIPVEATLTTGTARVRFADNDNGVVTQLNFGESITKKFTIENTGTVDANVRMYWENLVNTYLEGSLTYTLSYAASEDASYAEVIEKTNVPRSQSPSKKTLANSLTIPVGRTYYYELTITLNYLSDVNQDPDLNAVFNANFGVEDINEKFQVVFDANGGVVDISSKTITENEEYGILPIPTLEGYKFLGWYTEADEGSLVTSTSIVESNINHKLYAHWSALSFAEKIGISSQGVKTNFDIPATTDEGVFEMEDDYGMSYYYRGAVTNNYVQFAGFYWRIIRINGDGSLRIVYDGNQAYANGANTSDKFIGTSAYNTNYDDAKYVGYMYGPAGTTASTSKAQAQTNTTSSTIKTYIDNWYKTNIVDKGYSSAVADVLFCNDRSIPGKNTTLWTTDTGLGYGTNVTTFGAFGRFLTGNNSATIAARANIQPIFKCPQRNDAFTVSDTTHGNGALTYPVGLITVDEIVTAGAGEYNVTNTAFYLYNPNNWWWSLSSSMFHVNGYSSVLGINAIGHMFYTYQVNSSGGVSPVVNLNSEYANSLIGDGTMGNPYRVE